MVIRVIRPIEKPPYKRKGIVREVRPIEAPPSRYEPGGTGIPPEPIAGFPRTPTTPEPTIMKGTLIHEYTQRIEDIDPSAEYYLDETRKRTIKGQYLIYLLKRQQQRIKDYPRGTTFVKTPTGYRVIVPSGETVREPGGPLAGGISMLLQGPEYAYASLTGPTYQPGRPLISEEMYGMVEAKRTTLEQQWETGDILGLTKTVVSAPVVSGPIAYGAGFALGLGFRGVGAAAVGTTGIKAKVLGTFATRGPWVAGGTISGLVGADIGKTAAYEEHGLVPKGTTLGKATVYGLQFYAAGLGAMKAATFKLKKPIFGEHVVELKDPYVTARARKSYIELFGKKLYYGKTTLSIPKSSMVGFEPKPTYPYTPKGLSKAPTIYSQPPISKPLVPIAFKGTYRFLIPTDVQPKQPYEPSPFEISTKVLPKPKLYRSYETYFRVITYTPPSEPIVKVIQKPVVMKPFKPVKKSATDIIKDEKWMDFAKGMSKALGGGRVEKQGKYILIKATKEQMKKLEKYELELLKKKGKVKSPISEKIEVPKELQKPVMRFKRFQLQKLEPEQKFKGLKKTIQKQRVDTQQKVEQAFGVIAIQGQRQRFARATAFDKMLRFDTQQIFGQPQMIGQTQAQAQMVEQPSYQDFRTQMVFDVPYEQIRQVLPRQPTIPKQPTTKPPRVPRLPDLPTGDGEQEQPSELFARSYLVQTKIRTHYGGKKVKKDKWITQKKPLSKMDAMAYGANLTEHSAKASFRLVPSDRKPQRLSSRIPSWLLMGDQYYNRDNLFVEYSAHRINTPGEINEISRLGWNAPRKKRRRSRRLLF